MYKGERGNGQGQMKCKNGLIERARDSYVKFNAHVWKPLKEGEEDDIL
jgi:hypothetical protein